MSIPTENFTTLDEFPNNEGFAGIFNDDAIRDLEIGRLEAENERLREALLTAADTFYDAASRNAADRLTNDKLEEAGDRIMNILEAD